MRWTKVHLSARISRDRAVLILREAPIFPSSDSVGPLRFSGWKTMAAITLIIAAMVG